jgi:hypothetical protein
MRNLENRERIFVRISTATLYKVYRTGAIRRRIMYSLKQVAEKLGLAYTTIYYHIVAGRIKPSYTAGHSRIFTDADLEYLRFYFKNEIEKRNEDKENVKVM